MYGGGRNYKGREGVWATGTWKDEGYDKDEELTTGGGFGYISHVTNQLPSGAYCI